jgi:hypothetical protein
VGQVACDSQRGQAAIDQGVVDDTVPPATTPPATTTSPTDVTPTTAGATLPGGSVAPTVPSTAPPTTVAPTTTKPDPIDRLAPYAIGESVMLGAAPQLQAGGVQVNAAVSRQGKNVGEVIGQLRAAGQLGRTVVVQTGTTGPVSDKTLDFIMSFLPAKATPNVVFLTVRAPRGWIADNNIRIRQLPDRYPNVTVLDWAAKSEAVKGELAADGYHLRTSRAKQFYANLVFDAIGRPDLKK